MYCPSCGNEERQLSQYCRACGTDLRIVRNSLESPDSITQSAISAREHIGMAVADKIRQMKTAKDLEKIAEEVLPHFEKFLESPEERRLRRIRAGVITASIGFGAALGMFFLALAEADLLPLIAPGFIMFLIGIGVIINGLLFTLPRKRLPGDVQDAVAQNMLDATLNRRTLYEAPVPTNMTNELPAKPQRASVTEHTTHHLNTSKH
jgi:hypothetical protein